jgi:hypothetical protein
MLDFDRFDFNTTGDKVKITDTRTGDTYTGNRADYAKRVKTGFYASLAIAGIYGLGAGLLIAGKNASDSRTVRLKPRKTKRKIANGISRFCPWK